MFGLVSRDFLALSEPHTEVIVAAGPSFAGFFLSCQDCVCVLASKPSLEASRRLHKSDYLQYGFIYLLINFTKNLVKKRRICVDIDGELIV